jgi:hypothetical protein
MSVRYVVIHRLPMHQALQARGSAKWLHVASDMAVLPWGAPASWASGTPRALTNESAPQLVCQHRHLCASTGTCVSAPALVCQPRHLYQARTLPVRASVQHHTRCPTRTVNFLAFQEWNPFNSSSTLWLQGVLLLGERPKKCTMWTCS